MSIILGTWLRTPIFDDPDVVTVNLSTRRLARGATSIQLSPRPFLMATALLSAGRMLVSKADLHEILYADREDGGPDDGSKVIDVFLCRLRRDLAPIGFDVVTRHGRGFETRIIPAAEGWRDVTPHRSQWAARVPAPEVRP